jgi:hypothetical protein
LIYLTKDIPVSTLCKIARVSKSGYYYWLKDKIKDEEDILLIARIFYSKKQKAGFKMIKMTLRIWSNNEPQKNNKNNEKILHENKNQATKSLQIYIERIYEQYIIPQCC